MRLALALLLAAAPALAQPDPAALVNPFIGTTNGGNVFPGTRQRKITLHRGHACQVPRVLTLDKD